VAFTYDGTLDTDLEKVRLEIGDTDSTDPQFTDAEINYFLDGNSVTEAALKACEALVAKYSRQFDFETDQQKFLRSQRATAYRALADELRSGGASGLSTIGQIKKDGYSQDIAADEATTNTRTGHASVGYFNPDRSW
jgi:hypothetical protein